ncbi:uncharacterized protein C8Q71DRAFT_904392 [Rhodofomes roseus]|uniref:Uncharacterized protein n=1 Tax=Rhodofomes roseus TaxID=34475 RepID=A0ABQ8KUA2_9APHY|nr:uncharacterized protein C8Q71DRAFT_904392 [Rhodofomes roseus]KAH9841646.1 hypothetical protein C8Q71DRAFT_904392 [Rhodofomes roseus]
MVAFMWPSCQWCPKIARRLARNITVQAVVALLPRSIEGGHPWLTERMKARPIAYGSQDAARAQISACFKSIIPFHKFGIQGGNSPGGWGVTGLGARHSYQGFLHLSNGFLFRAFSSSPNH